MTNATIVVGLDESPSSRAALHWAAEYAKLTRSVLRAIHVLDWPYGLDEADVVPPGVAGGRLLMHDEIETLYRGRITSVFDEVDPRPDWLIQFAHGEVGRVLVHQSEHAALLVVGTREHVGLGRLATGSVSHYCLSHALCPVVAVPAPNPLAAQAAPEGAAAATASMATATAP
jgi:nucleotide-binding universal stress UspA family protein